MVQDLNTPISIGELRDQTRFEPVSLNAEIKSTDGKKATKAIVLDVSRSGMAVAIEKNVILFKDNEKITIDIWTIENGDKLNLRGGGVVVRKTNKSDFGDLVNQLSIKFKKEIADNENLYDSYFFSGIRQKRERGSHLEQ